MTAATAPWSGGIDGGQIASLFLVMMRCAGLVVAAPILGHRAVPMPVKAGLIAVLAIALSSRANAAPGALPVVMAAPIELIIGLALGYIVSLGFQAVELAGRLMSLQMGLSLGAVFNPTSHESSTSLDPFFSIAAGLLFLGLNLHVALVEVLARSFLVLPIGGGWPMDLFLLAANTTGLALELGTRLALPLALVLLLVELAMALLARAIPQINVFVLGMPIKILAGLAILVPALPNFLNGAANIFRGLIDAASTGVVR